MHNSVEGRKSSGVDWASQRQWRHPLPQDLSLIKIMKWNLKINNNKIAFTKDHKTIQLYLQLRDRYRDSSRGLEQRKLQKIVQKKEVWR